MKRAGTEKVDAWVEANTSRLTEEIEKSGYTTLVYDDGELGCLSLKIPTFVCQLTDEQQEDFMCFAKNFMACCVSMPEVAWEAMAMMAKFVIPVGMAVDDVIAGKIASGEW
jgi:hypothetical protein